MKNPDIRWIQRFRNFNDAFAQLAKAVKLAQERPLSELEQQGMIQAFEFTHELAWNVLKDYLNDQGFTNITGSRDAARESFKNGLLENGDIWLEMIHSRNQSTHTYNSAIADQIAEAITSVYLPEFEKFRAKFAELEGQSS